MVHTRADDTARGRVSRIERLRAQAPLVPRPTGPSGAEPLIQGNASAARVALSTGAAGPVGGDHYDLEVVVGAGSSLLLSEVSATLALPGPHGERSLTEVRIQVEDGATLVWVPQPVIAAHRCFHEQRVRIDLAASARLLLREELVLGRHGEAPGRLSTHLEVRRGGRPLLVQGLAFGPAAHGYDSPAVLGRHRGVGTVVVVHPQGHGVPGSEVEGTTALMPLDGHVLQISALAADGLGLRRRLDAALARLGPPWADPRARDWSAVPR